MTGSLPTDVMTVPAHWSDHGPGYAFPQAPVTAVADGILWTPNAAPTIGIDRNAFMGVKPSNIEPGVTYRIAVTVSGAASPSQFRAAVADSGVSSAWAPADGNDKILSFTWTADDANPIIGVEYGPIAAGAWATDVGDVTIKFITLAEDPAAPPLMTCAPNYALGYPAMWVMGNGFRGSSIKNLERVTNDGERIEVRGSAGIKFTNERSYREVRDFEPDGEHTLTPQSYQRIIDAYPKPEYADLLYLDTPTRQFSVIDNETPYNKEFHYEITIYNDPDDPDDVTVYKTDKCEFSAPPQQFFSPVPCSPVVFTDPLIMEKADWVGLLSIDPLSYPGRRELFDVIGRRTPVAYSQVRQTARTTIRIITGILPNGIATPSAVRRALKERAGVSRTAVLGTHPAHAQPGLEVPRERLVHLGGRGHRGANLH